MGQAVTVTLHGGCRILSVLQVLTPLPEATAVRADRHIPKLGKLIAVVIVVLPDFIPDRPITIQSGH